MPSARAAEVSRLEVRKTIHAPREAVFRAWTTPESIKRWFSTREAPVRNVTIEPRVGGKLLIECDYQGGVWRLKAEIREYRAPQRLAFTWVSEGISAEIGSVVTVDLSERGGRTELVLRQEGFPSLEKREENAGGWTALMDNIAGEAGDAPGTLRAVVKKFIPAPPEAVYHAWVSPELAAKFMGYLGGDAKMTADVRVGGRFHIDMHGGKEKTIPHDGEYLVVDPPHRLVFTWESPYSAKELRSTVSLTFQPADGGTDLTLVHERFSDEANRKDHEGGWADFVNQLAVLAKIGFSVAMFAKAVAAMKEANRA